MGIQGRVTVSPAANPATQAKSWVMSRRVTMVDGSEPAGGAGSRTRIQLSRSRNASWLINVVTR